MCLDIMTPVLSIGSSMLTQTAQAKRQNAAYQQNALNANKSAVEQYYQTNLNQIQEQAKALQQKLATQEETTKAKGTALASTQNSGQSTLSVLRDIERQGAKAANTTDINSRNAAIETASNKEAVQQQTQGRIDSVAQASEPDLISASLSGLGGYLGVQANKTKYDNHNTGDPKK